MHVNVQLEQQPVNQPPVLRCAGVGVVDLVGQRSEKLVVLGDHGVGILSLHAR